MPTHAQPGIIDQIGRVLVRRSEVLTKVGDYNGALTSQLEALALRERLQDMEGLAEVNNHIGSIYQYQKNYDKAEEYYGRSLGIYTNSDCERELGKAYNNFGALYEDTKQPERAVQLHRRSLKIWEHLADSGWMAVSFMHLGICFDQLEMRDTARYYLFKSAEILKGRDNPYLLSMLYHGLGTNYLSSGNPSQALQWCKRSLAIADNMKIALLQQKGCDCLAQVYDRMGDKGLALAYYKQFIVLRDSLFGLANAQGITRIEMSHSFAKQQLADSLERGREKLRLDLAYQQELARGREQRNVVMFGSLGILALAIGLWSRLRYVRRSRAVIERERERSEELLLNILPRHIAQELKDTGQAKAREIDNVSILFTDFGGLHTTQPDHGPAGACGRDPSLLQGVRRHRHEIRDRESEDHRRFLHGCRRLVRHLDQVRCRHGDGRTGNAAVHAALSPRKTGEGTACVHHARGHPFRPGGRRHRRR